jgi:hypothetical protein
MNLQEEITKIKNMMSEGVKNPKEIHAAVLGYLDLYGDKIMETAKDKMKMLQAKKEVMIHCEKLRDGKPPIRFSIPESSALYNTVLKLIKNMDTTELVKRGMNINHTN